METTITLNKLNIGFGSNTIRTDNTFTITGDITLDAQCNKHKFTITVDTLKVTYNHDGLLADVKRDLDVFCDAESRFEPTDIEYDAWGYSDCVLNTDGSSLSLCADFVIFDEDKVW